jgi:hypothetical protein
MKKPLLFLFLAPLCMAQEVRYDNMASTTGNPVSGVPAPAGSLVPILGISNAQINVCTVTTPTPCITPLTTFTDNTGAASCPTATPLTRPNVVGCFSTADAGGNWGMWVPPGTAFQYMITTTYGTFGPYSANAPGSSGGGGGVSPPAFAVQFANAAATGSQTDPTFTFYTTPHALGLAAEVISQTNPAYSSVTDPLGGGYFANVASIALNTSGNPAQGPSFSNSYQALEMSGNCLAPGWDIGGNGLSPIGPDWATCFGIVGQTNSYTPGIFQGVNFTINGNKGGDDQAGGFTVNCTGGDTDPAAEGCAALGLHTVQRPASYFFSGTVSATGAAGATTVTLTSGGAGPFEPTNAVIYDTQTPVLSNFHATGANTTYTNMGVFYFPVDASLTQSTQCSMLGTLYGTWTANTTYALGAQINYSANSLRWVVVHGGTSGGTVPAAFSSPVPGVPVIDGGVTWMYGGQVVPGIMQSINPASPTPVTVTFDCNYGAGTALANDTSGTASWLAGGEVERVKLSSVSGFTGGVISVGATGPPFGMGCPDGGHLVNATGGGGTGAQALIACSAGVPYYLYVTNPGTGYTSTPTFAIAGYTGTFFSAISTKLQTAVLTPRLLHGVAPTNASSSIWQGGTNGYYTSGLWTANGWTDQYSCPGSVDSSHLACEFVSASNPVPPNTQWSTCGAGVTLTGLTTTGTTVTGGLPTNMCGPYYTGIGSTGSFIKTAVLSCPGNSSYNTTSATVFTIDPTRFILTWNQTGATGTCASATISYPPSVFAANLYKGVEITQPCTQGSTTTSCPLDVNDVTFTAGDTYSTGPNPSIFGFGIRNVYQINGPDATTSTGPLNIAMQGGGINGTNGGAIGIVLQNLNQFGTPNAGLYFDNGGSYPPPQGISIQGAWADVIHTDPAQPGFSTIAINCPLDGCGDNTHQSYLTGMDGLLAAEWWPEVRGWALTNDNNFIVQNGYIEGGQSIGINGGGSAQPTAPNSEFFTAPVFTTANFVALGRGTAANTTTFLSTPINGDQSATLGTGQLVAGEISAAAQIPTNCAVYNIGTPGSTSYTYLVASVTLNGGHSTYVSAATGSGNATLSGTNYNNVVCQIAPGTVSQEVWRVTGGTAGRICSASTTVVPNNNPACPDTGQAPSPTGSPTNTDTSGTLYVGGTATIAETLKSGLATNTDMVGEITLSGGTGSYTFVNTYTNRPECFIHDHTTPTATPSFVVTSTTLTVTGTGTDVIGYGCIARN